MRTSLILSCVLFSINAFSLPKPLSVPTDLKTHIEASAIVYVDDQDRFLVASDDTKDDQPLLFWMDRHGNVESRPARIFGIKHLTDIESLSQDSGWLYIMSSQSLTKKGGDKKDRDLFIRARIMGSDVQAVNVVRLRPMILDALDETTDPTLRFLSKEEVEIESHFIKNGHLYVGLKTPEIHHGRGVILRVGTFEEIFEQQKLKSLRLWRVVDFHSVTGDEDRLSDIFPTGESLIFTTTTTGGWGRVWCYRANHLQLLKEWDGYRCEGVTFDPIRNLYVVVFDQGKKDSLYLASELNCSL